LKQFTEEDKNSMEVILSNTIKNANVVFDPKNKKVRKPSKTVNFETERNNYYSPKIWK